MPGGVRAKGLRILLSEGGSTSAREAITALGLHGHHVEIVDPSPYCLGRFSRFVRRFHRCPPMGTDPEGYRDFILALLAERRFDVLVPIHEQGYLLAKIEGRLAPHVAVALPSFESYEQAVSGTGFSRLLSELDLPQPRTRVVADRQEIQAGNDFPLVLKLEIGTASRGVRLVNSRSELGRAVEEIEAADAFGDGILVQELVAGSLERAQAVFSRGRLVAAHGFRQLLGGAGGGDAMKESIDRPQVRAHLAQIGSRLGWHGALSVDYILRQADRIPVYIDCNPRLVEPMSSVLSGNDLLDALVKVSTGEDAQQPPSRPGVRSHLAMQVLMGLGLRGATRREILRECWRLAAGRGPYGASREELTPVELDWAGGIPLLMTAAALSTSPRWAKGLAARGWGANLLTPEAMRRIRSWPG